MSESMPMMWMRMPGQTWAGSGASFLGMWVVMMAAMMLPSLVPALWRYREMIGATDATRVGRLTAVVVGYLFVWTVLGAMVFPFGVALAELQMRQPAFARVAPVIAGAAVLFAGLLQLSPWKARHLALCRDVRGGDGALATDAGAAWRDGLQLGARCSRSCAGLMAVVLILGVMDIRVMAAATIAISAERLAPGGVRVARIVGVIIVAVGFMQIARAAGLG